MNNQQRILIIGGGGFLGSHLCHYFSHRPYQVMAVGHPPRFAETGLYDHLRFHYLTLPDQTLAWIVKEFKPDVLIFSAGTNSVPASVTHPYQDFQRSVECCAFTMETLRIGAPDCFFVFLSSAAVYGNPQILPIQEEAPCLPISPYGYHKKICELLIEEYGQLYNLKTAVVRVFSAYGERLLRQVVYDTLQKILDPHQGTIEMFGTGQETRDFIHASDIAYAIECLIHTKQPGIYNLASGQSTQILEVVHWLKMLTNSRKEVIFNHQTREGDPLYWQADMGRLQKMGFSPKVSLNEGIGRYIDWFKKLVVM